MSLTIGTYGLKRMQEYPMVPLPEMVMLGSVMRASLVYPYKPLFFSPFEKIGTEHCFVGVLEYWFGLSPPAEMILDKEGSLTHSQLSGISNGISSAMQTGSLFPIFS